MAKKKEDVAAQATVKKEKKKNPALRLIIFLVELVLLIGGIVGAVMMVKKYNDPKLTAENYFKALLAGDYATAYGYLEPVEEENAFINESTYAVAMESLGITDYADDYEIVEKGTNKYVLECDGDEYLTIRLHEQDAKRFLVFKDYEVEQLDMYAEDVSITAPKDVTLTIGGIVLDSSNCERDQESYLSVYETSYTIPKMFVGDYVVEVTGGDVYQAYTETLSIDTYNTYFYLSQPYLAEGLADTLINRSYDLLAAVYQEAMNQDETSATLEAEKTGYLQDTDYLDNGYESIKYDLEISDGFFEYLNVSDFSGEIDWYSYNYDDGNLEVQITLDYTEDYGYQTLDWWSDQYEESTDTGYGDASFEYTYVNGEWVLTYFYIYSGIYAW